MMFVKAETSELELALGANLNSNSPQLDMRLIHTFPF
jgi:hypothetical protein